MGCGLKFIARNNLNEGFALLSSLARGTWIEISDFLEKNVAPGDGGVD
jgi:hypothetical protein